MKLSVIILARNAGKLLVDCIASVNFADEIIVIDNSSRDKTKELAKKLGAKVFECDAESFAQKRMFGLEKAKGEWVLYIDTDERVSAKLANEIKQVINGQSSKSGDEIKAYSLQRQNFYLGNNPWPKIEKLERLFLHSALKGWYGELHESPRVEGKVGELDGYLLHYTHRDLSSMLEKTIVWSGQEAKLRFDAHHPHMTWWRFPRVMITAFWDSYITQQGWRAGTMGLVESTYQAFSMFVTYARLWELQQKQIRTSS